MLISTQSSQYSTQQHSTPYSSSFQDHHCIQHCNLSTWNKFFLNTFFIFQKGTMHTKGCHITGLYEFKVLSLINMYDCVRGFTFSNVSIFHDAVVPYLLLPHSIFLLYVWILVIL